MWSDFHAKKLTTLRERELAANQAESENQAGLVPDPGPAKKISIFSPRKDGNRPAYTIPGPISVTITTINFPNILPISLY